MSVQEPVLISRAEVVANEVPWDYGSLAAEAKSEPLQEGQALAGAGQRKAGAISIHRFAGADAVFLFVIDGAGLPIEQVELLSIGKFLNDYLADTGAAGPDRSGETADDRLLHATAPMDWHIGNFVRYVREHNIGADEFRMMTGVAIGARAVFGLCERFDPADLPCVAAP